MSEPPDPAADLLAMAREDLAAAMALRDSGAVSGAPVGFHAQQAVEKALKAAIATAGGEFPFTHDLGVLMQLCEDRGLELPEQIRDADRLNPYAGAIRYGFGDPAAVAPAEAIKWAAGAIAWAEGRHSKPPS